MASSRQIARKVRDLRLEIETAVMGRPTGTRSRAIALQVAGLLLQAEGVAEGAALDVEPIDHGRAPLALA